MAGWTAAKRRALRACVGSGLSWAATAARVRERPGACEREAVRLGLVPARVYAAAAPRPGARDGTFAAADPEEAASVVRGVLIDRLDDIADGEAWAAACAAFLRDRDPLRLLQALQVVFFPEEFMDPGEPHPEGLIPRGGPPRVGGDRLDGYARLAGAIGAGFNRAG